MTYVDKKIKKAVIIMEKDEFSGLSEIKRIDFQNTSIWISPGQPLPFGAVPMYDGVNFSVFSRSAAEIELALYLSNSENSVCNIELDSLLNKTGDIWHVKIMGLSHDVWKEIRYGYRVKNSDDPNMEKVLIEPYSRALSGGAVWGRPKNRPGNWDFLQNSDFNVNYSEHKPLVEHDYNAPASFKNRCRQKGDMAYVRRSFIPDCSFSGTFDWQGDRPLNRPLKDTIIYEMHVRGFTRHESSKVSAPGTFTGIIEKIPYFKKLGITALELMPINEFDELENQNTNPVTGSRLLNYWGYSPIAFFTPKASYAASGEKGNQVREFKEMVRALHKAGIEVILDVVFNHTAEGNEYGPSYTFKGFDKSIYYMLNPDGMTYKNYSGCGNTMNCNHPLVHSMIIDCLRYWVTEMHVDGFRFDLASILGRDATGRVLSNPPVVEAIDEDPVLAKTKIIAEAWDAAGLYQVGKFHSWGRWAEWNGKYRDNVRRFIKGDNGLTGELATRICGSSDLYHTSGRKPYHSINFITAHDGFTLWDLFSYNSKRNFMNGEKNGDGSNDNYSWNCGKEGDTTDKDVLKMRFKMMKNAFVTLMVSQGTPMMLAGDEFANSQLGNNNAYCQDNSISWLDWSLLNKNKALFNFVAKLIRFRLEHASLRREFFFTGKPEDPNSTHPDVSWHGIKPFKPDFSEFSRSLAVLINGSVSRPVDKDIYIAFNSWIKPLKFELPLAPSKKRWKYKINTAKTGKSGFYNNEDEPYVKAKSIKVDPYSVALLIT
jgi:glycogen operon protein